MKLPSSMRNQQALNSLIHQFHIKILKEKPDPELIFNPSANPQWASPAKAI
jgi:hypothetical protein